eukprot:3727303-Prymnesium_polylepis.1
MTLRDSHIYLLVHQFTQTLDLPERQFPPSLTASAPCDKPHSCGTAARAVMMSDGPVRTLALRRALLLPGKGQVARPLSQLLRAGERIGVAHAVGRVLRRRRAPVEAQVVQRARKVGKRAARLAEAVVAVVDAARQDAPDAGAPRRLELALVVKPEARDPRPRPRGPRDPPCQLRPGDALPGGAPPAHGSERLGRRPRRNARARLVERRQQPLGALGSARGWRLQIARRVGGAVVPLVEAPLADLARLRRAAQRVLDAIGVVEDVAVGRRADAGAALNLEGVEHAVLDPERRRRDRVAPHLEHPAEALVGKRVALERERDVVPERREAPQHRLVHEQRRRPHILHVAPRRARRVLVDDALVAGRAVHVAKAEGDRRLLGGQVAQRLHEHVVRLRGGGGWRLVV